MARRHFKSTDDDATRYVEGVLLMKVDLDPVEQKMLIHLAQKGVLLKRRYTDRKKYLSDLIRHLYLKS